MKKEAREKKKAKVNTFRNPSVSITIRYPSEKEKRRKFSLSLVRIAEEGARSQKSLKLKELDAINCQFKDGEIDYNQALELVENLKASLVKKYKIKLGFTTSQGAISKSNRMLANSYISREMKKDTCKRTKQGLKREVERILKIMRDLSLLTAKEDEIYGRYWGNEGYCYSPETLKRSLCRLNGLLAEAQRDIKIKIPLNLPKKRVKYIDEKELKLLITEVKRHFDKVAIKIMFYTGLRTGELFALGDNHVDFKKNIIFVDWQRTRDWEKKLPKKNKQRIVVFPSFLKNDLKEFLDFREDCLKSQRETLTKRILNASRRLWRGQKQKHISNHRLRSSHAVWMIEKHGATIAELVYQLGDREDVIREYYAGFLMSKGIAEKLSQRLG